MVFDKIQYTGEPVKFPDRNGAGLAEDLFDLCVSYVEGELKLDMTALNQSNKDCSCDRLFKFTSEENTISAKRKRVDEVTSVNNSDSTNSNTLCQPDTDDLNRNADKQYVNPGSSQMNHNDKGQTNQYIPSYSQAVQNGNKEKNKGQKTKKNNRTNNLEVVRKIVDGQPSISYSKTTKQSDDDGFTV
ncbi:unnamed protein product, partial [Brachionus calyciflorus]